MKQLKIIYKPLADLVPYASNSRTHTEYQVNQIANSMQEWGWTNPVLIDEHDGIIAGHGRIMAAAKLKIDQVPCIVMAGLTDAQRKAYVLADNKIALNAGWDFEMLAVELDLINDMGFDMTLLGFDKAELNDLIGTPNPPPLDEPKDQQDDDLDEIKFLLTSDQLAQVKRALKKAKNMPAYAGDGNEDGNALAMICEMFVTQNSG